jgi:hypothetical protein
MHLAFQYIGPRTSFKSAQHLDVACVRRQDNDSSVGNSVRMPMIASIPFRAGI